MKKIFVLSLFVMTLFVSCTEETTYSITNKIGDTVTLTINECDGNGTAINLQTVAIVNNETKALVADEKTVLLKLYISGWDCWVQQIFYLENNNSITLDGYTIVGPYRP